MKGSGREQVWSVGDHSIKNCRVVPVDGTNFEASTWLEREAPPGEAATLQWDSYDEGESSQPFRAAGEAVSSGESAFL